MTTHPRASSTAGHASSRPRPSQDFSPRSAHGSDLVIITRRLLEPETAPHRVLRDDQGGYLILDASAPEDPDGLTVDYFAPVCLSCFLDQHPEAGRGMDVARRSALGSARYVEAVGDWLPEADE